MIAQTAHTWTEEDLTLGKIFEEEIANCECQAAGQTVGHPASWHSYDRDDIHIRTAVSDGPFRRFGPVTLPAHILYLSHYPKLAGRPRKRCMYDIMRQNLYPRQMANDVFKTVQKCGSCSQN